MNYKPVFEEDKMVNVPYNNVLNELKCVYKALPIGFCMLNRDLVCVKINDYLAKAYEKKISECVGRTVYKIIPSTWHQVGTICEQVNNTGKAVVNRIFSSTQYVKSNEGRYWRVNFYPQMDDGIVQGISYVAEDITDSKKNEESYEQLFALDRLLNDISGAFINLPTNEIDERIEYWLHHIVEFFDADRSNLNEYLKNERAFHCIHSWAVRGVEPLPPYFGTKQFPWVTKIILNGEIVKFSKVEDLPDEARTDRDSYFEIGTKSHISIPLSVGGSIVGTLSLASVRSHRNWPDYFIERFQRVGEIFDNILLRKQKDIELQKAFSEISHLKDLLELDKNYLQEEIKLAHNFKEIIGESVVLKDVLSKIERVACTDVTVVILGETGTGKELIARAIHNSSPRRDRPLMKVNCPSLPSTLIESELFGCEKGAFTGAESKRLGRFEVADGATIFLDEIGDLPLELQPKLLRFLQDGEFERLGSAFPLKSNVRVIAATNRNLEKEVKNGNFRRDLWYRLNVYPINVPPLRERKEDIPALANFFVNKFSNALKKNIKRIHPNVMNFLQEYAWPGNIRELENFIERAVINSSGNILCMVEMFEAKTLDIDRFQTKSLAEFEFDYIGYILQKTNWVIEGERGAAKILAINPSTLRARMRKLGLKKS